MRQTAGGQPVRCEPRRRARANQLMTGRKLSDGIETGVESLPGMSLGATCLLPRRCPASRWRELGSGSGAERGNLRCDTVRPLAAGESEIPEQRKLQGAE